MFSDPSRVGENNVHDGYRRLNLVVNGMRTEAAPPFAFVLDEYEPILNAWLSSLEPGGFIRPHRDAGPWRERWHVPVQPAGWIRQGGATITPEAGVPFLVEHWVEHELANPTVRERVHLVIDRQKIAQPGRGGFDLLGESQLEQVAG